MSPSRPVRTTVPRDDAETRTRVIDAAVACILERGFYRASSNEIARGAGVTWGVIQHYFGTREALMLAVLEDGARRFRELVEASTIDAPATEGRVEQLLDVLAQHYGQPEYLAYLQILLNLEHDPKTSAAVRATMDEVARQSHDHVRRLLREALGAAAATPDLATTVFLTLRGFVLSQQLLDAMAYDVVAPQTGRVARQRHLLAVALAPTLDAHHETTGKGRSRAARENARAR